MLDFGYLPRVGGQVYFPCPSAGPVNATCTGAPDASSKETKETYVVSESKFNKITATAFVRHAIPTVSCV